MQICEAPDGGKEKYLLCRRVDRRAREEAMRAKFAQRIEDGLQQMAAGLQRRSQDVATITRRVGRLLQRNQRDSALFDIQVTDDAGQTQITWKKSAKQAWAELSEGCYILRTNVADWSDEELWRAYIQLTEAESAFRLHKTDLSLRPVWHQKAERVRSLDMRGHIGVRHELARSSAQLPPALKTEAGFQLDNLPHEMLSC